MDRCGAWYNICAFAVALKRRKGVNNFDIVFLGTCACNYARYEHRFSEDLKNAFDNDVFVY